MPNTFHNVEAKGARGKKLLRTLDGAVQFLMERTKHEIRFNFSNLLVVPRSSCACKIREQEQAGAKLAGFRSWKEMRIARKETRLLKRR